MLVRRFAAAAATSSAPLRQVAARRALATAAATTERIVFSSPHANLDIPNKTIWDVARERAASIGDRNAFICGLEHTQLTFAELYERAGRLAHALAQDGLRKGDAVLVHSFNDTEYPIVVVALTALGAVCSPAPPMFRTAELAQQAKAANAKFIFTHADLKDVALETADQVGIQRKHIYTIGKATVPKLKSVAELTRHEMGAFDFDKVEPDTNLFLPFSSGTTGAPKGVALSAGNLMANTMQVSYMEPFGDHSLGLLPFYHIYALNLLHMSIFQGTAKVVLPRFEPHTFLNALATYKIRAAHIVPPIALFLANHPMVKDYDLSATDFLVSGGAPMGKEVESLVKERLGVSVKQAYGLTEASPTVNYTENAFYKPGSVGRLVPNTELRVRCTATGVDLPANERGELLYRGPQVMLGYHNNPDATKGVFTDDGFLCTGDIGYIDDDGFVFLVDRVKELIKYKGHQVAPAELEDVLNHHPLIMDSCVIRGRDEFGEELPKAFVVLKDKANAEGLTEDDVMAFVAENVAAFKKVRQLEFIDAIPKSPTGKILRRQLQDVENSKYA